MQVPVSIPQLREDVQALQQSSSINDVQLHYLASLLEKADTAAAHLQPQLVERVNAKLLDTQAQLELARETAQQQLEQLQEQMPANDPQLIQAHSFFNQGEYHQLKRLSKSLERNLWHDQQIALLKELKDYLDALETNLESSNPQSFDELLQQQEFSLLADKSHLSTSGNSDVGLKSMGELRESWSKLNAEKLIKLALENAPENPGPLNTEMLMVKSLAAMRDLSPAYLKRFIGFMDTLFWLDKASR